MTREEAITRVEAIDFGKMWLELQEDSKDSKTYKFVDMAIKALSAIEQIRWERDIAIEQLKELGYGLGEKIRTSEDAISRADAINALGYDISIESDGGLDEYKSVIKEMLCKIYDVQKANIEKLPPVTPQPKIGHWIPVSERLPEDFDTYLITLENGDVCKCEFNPDFIDEEHEKGAFTYYHQYFDQATLGMIDEEEEAVDAIALMPFEPYKAESEG